jgi:hypothetical protein
MGGLGKLVDVAAGAIKGAAKVGIVASKWGKIDTMFRPKAFGYKDDAGEHYFSVTLVNEKEYGKGPTLLFMGDLSDERMEKTEESLIYGIKVFYKEILLKDNDKKVKKGKFQLLDEKIEGQELLESGVRLGMNYLSAMHDSAYTRKGLAKHFKHIDYLEEERYALPKAKEGKVGEYFLKWRESGMMGDKNYVAPVEGVGKLWFRTEVMRSKALEELSRQYGSTVDKKARKELQKNIETYAKGVLKGEAE